MARFVVAITGGIASGKSAVAALFANLGVVVADADIAARAIVAPGQPALAQIQARFGQASLLADGALDRAWLRAQVFADDGARRELEAITHPPIQQWLLAACSAAEGPYAIAAIPLLAETGSMQAYSWLSRVLVVDVPAPVQRARLLARDGIDGVLADSMIRAQAGRDQRLSLATDVIVNDGSLADLAAPVLSLDGLYRRLAADQP